jgi:oligosaccharide repeat unit polymerase
VPTNHLDSSYNPNNYGIEVEWIAAFLLSHIFLLLWVLCRKIQGSWISPGAMFTACWYFMSLFPLMVVYYYPLYLEAYVAVLAFCVVAVAGTLFASHCLREVDNIPPVSYVWDPVRIKYFNILFTISSILGTFSPIVLYKTAVAKYGVTGIFELAGKISGDRYNGEFDQPFAVTLLNMTLSLAAIMGGFLLGAQNKRFLPALVYLYWMIPLQVSTTIQTTKASMMFTVVFFGSGLLAGIGLRGGQAKVRFSRLFILIFTLSGFAFIFTLINSFIRYGLTDLSILSEMIGASAGTSFGHMSVFGTWLHEGGLQKTECAGGTYSFAGVAQYIGFGDRKQGLYELSVYFANGYFSNIYTGFRSLIEDFTLPGAFFFLFGFSFLAQVCWSCLTKGKLWAASVCVSWFSYTFISPITSIFTYNMNFGALTMFSLAVILLDIPWGVPKHVRNSPALRALLRS